MLRNALHAPSQWEEDKGTAGGDWPCANSGPCKRFPQSVGGPLQWTMGEGAVFEDQLKKLRAMHPKIEGRLLREEVGEKKGGGEEDGPAVWQRGQAIKKWYI